MKTLKLLILTLALTLVSTSSFAAGLEGDVKDSMTRLFEGINPGYRLIDVFDELVARWESADTSDLLSTDDKVKISRALKDAERANEIRVILGERGFNWLVFHYFEVLVTQETFDKTSLANSVTGLEPAGIPPYQIVQIEGLQVDIENTVRINYQDGIYDVILRINTHLDEIMTTASRSGLGTVWLYDRSGRIMQVIDAFEELEALLNQYQGFLATLEIKIKRHASDLSKVKALEELRAKTQQDVEDFAAQAHAALDRGRRSQQGSTWLPMSRSLAQAGLSAEALKKRFTDQGEAFLKAVDKIEETEKDENQYSNDTPYELRMARNQQQTQLESLNTLWGSVRTASYYKRHDEWRYTHEKKTSQHGSFRVVDDRMKSEAVYYDLIPPVLEESDVVSKLLDIGRLSLSRQDPTNVIQDIIAQVEDIKASHEQYIRGKPQQERDTQERFRERNRVITDSVAAVLDSLYRQLAEANQGYIGVNFQDDKAIKYEELLKKLRKGQTIRRAIQWTTGVGSTAAGACFYLLQSGAL